MYEKVKDDDDAEDDGKKKRKRKKLADQFDNKEKLITAEKAYKILRKISPDHSKLLGLYLYYCMGSSILHKRMWRGSTAELEDFYCFSIFASLRMTVHSDECPTRSRR